MKNNIWNVFIHELKRNFQRRGYLFTTFGVPVIGFLAFTILSAASGGGNDQDTLSQLEDSLETITQTGYVDYSGLFAEPSPLVADTLTAYPDEATADAAIKDGDINIYYIIATDFAETGAVTLIAPEFAPGEFVSVEAPIQNLVYGRLIDDEVDTARLLRIISPTIVERIELQPETNEGVVRDEEQEYWVVYAFGFAFMMALFTTNGYLMQTVIEEKENKLVEILLSSVRPMQLLAGKILGLGVVGMFQIVVWITTGLVLSQLAGDSAQLADSVLAQLNVKAGVLPLMLLYFALGYLMFAAAFGAVGALSNSMSEGPNLALIFTMPAISPFFVLQTFVSDPNGTLAMFMSIFPITAPIGMTLRLNVTDVPFIQVVISLILVLLTAIGMIWMAGRLFRVSTLLSGQMPKLREIPKLIFS